MRRADDNETACRVEAVADLRHPAAIAIDNQRTVYARRVFHVTDEQTFDGRCVACAPGIGNTPHLCQLGFGTLEGFSDERILQLGSQPLEVADLFERGLESAEFLSGALRFVAEMLVQAKRR